MAESKFKLPPLNPPTDNDATTEDNASKLSRARALMAEVQDDQENATQSTTGGSMPVNVSPFVPAGAADLPPAVQGQIAAQAGALASQLRANDIAARMIDPGVATLSTRGDEPTPFSVAEPAEYNDGKHRIFCANCGRSWEYSMSMAGSTIPCSGCNQMIEVPYPDQLRSSAPDADSFAEAVEEVPTEFGSPVPPAATEADGTTNDEGGEKRNGDA